MKKIAKAIISMGVVMAFAGCSWQIPQTVAVKTEADYSFSLGNFTNDLDESMDKDSMLGNSDGVANVAKYDYFPGKIDKNTQHYLLDLKVLDATVVSSDTAKSSSVFGSITEVTDDVPINTLENSTATVGLDFNPSTILVDMASSMGNDLEGKIKFASVPMYLYCVMPEGLDANVELKMFYGTKDSTPVQNTTPEVIFDNGIENKPKPAFQMEDNTVITNFDNTSYVNKVFVTDYLNMQNIPEESQLCISYELSAVKAKRGFDVAYANEHGIAIQIYAVIDLPLYFDVLEDVAMDVNKMSGGSEEAAEATETSNDAVTETKENEFSKYLNVMDAVSFKYIIYNLPLYSSAGMSLGIDLVGDGNYERGTEIKFVEKGKNITEDDKSVMELKQTTIQRMKAASQINPNFKIFINKDTRFSIPREKKIDMNIEIGFTTNGTVQVK
ncbi:hypothetical protein [Treponema bryantii]|uniref:hypothetical protein n=1 Tax=Treponema bryantii TaxID=163 RepID=UPI0003B592A2|nr:hypothetical protein [Treponema bryantii]